MFKRWFDWRYAVLSLVVNGIAIYLINADESQSGIQTHTIVQAFVSVVLAPFSMAYTLRKVAHESTFWAYFFGSFVMATAVAFIGGIAHWAFDTPDLFWTVVWNFGINVFGGSVAVGFRRNYNRLSPWIRWWIDRLL